MKILLVESFAGSRAACCIIRTLIKLCDRSQASAYITPKVMSNISFSLLLPANPVLQLGQRGRCGVVFAALLLLVLAFNYRYIEEGTRDLWYCLVCIRIQLAVVLIGHTDV